MTLEILAYIAAAVTLFVSGIAFHGYLTRQKSPTLELDAIRAAASLLAAARTSAANDVTNATCRQQAIDLALSQAAAQLSPPAAMKAA